LTPDDIGGKAGDPTSATPARQNVIFELGFFAANSAAAAPVCCARAMSKFRPISTA